MAMHFAQSNRCKSSDDAHNTCIILVNWNGWQDTVECLESLFRISFPAYRIVVVDNDSTDGSLHYIRYWAQGKLDVCLPSHNPLKHQSHPPIQKPILYSEFEIAGSSSIIRKSYESVDHKLVLIRSHKNLGFAGGNNIGIRYAMTQDFDYFLLLNNDTVVDENFLHNLFKNESKEGDALIGGKILYYDKPHLIQSLGARMNIWQSKYPPIAHDEHDSSQCCHLSKADYISGALLLIPRRAVEQIGFLDEDYFLYVEEVDYCYRACRAGFKIMIKPKAKIWHKISVSSGGHASPMSLYQTFKNRTLFIRKNFPGKFSILLLPLIYRCVRVSCSCIIQRNLTGCRSCIKGLLDGIFKAMTL